MRRALSIWTVLAVVAGTVIAISLCVGSASFDVGAGWHALVHPDDPAHVIVVELRLPRVAAGFAVGAFLAIAGALLQILLRNPLADPYVLGLSGGAALGALAAIATAAPAFMTGVGAAIGSALSMLALMALARSEFRTLRPEGAGDRLLLSGVMLAALWGAVLTLGLSLSSERRLQALLFWLMGDLAGAQPGAWAWLVLVAASAVAIADAPRLNLLARGEDQALSLGVSVGMLKLRVVVVSTIASGAAVALAGPVGFVGLVAPHLLRILYGNDQRVLLPGAALLGGTLVVCADTLARTVAAPRQLPLGAVTAVLGAPVFLYLLRRRTH